MEKQTNNNFNKTPQPVKTVKILNWTESRLWTWPSLQDFSDNWRAAAPRWRADRSHPEVLILQSRIYILPSFSSTGLLKITATNIFYRKCALFLIHNFPLKITNLIFADHGILQHMHMKGIKYKILPFLENTWI